MRLFKALVVPAVLFLLVTAESGTQGPGPSPTTSQAASSPTPTPVPTPPNGPSPSPSPSPIPTGAYLSLDVSAGGPATSITVTGQQFLPNEKMSLYWDAQSKVIGSAAADGNGNFGGVTVKPFAGDPPGLHHICASVAPNPCAQFELQGAPTPTPTPPASPSASPSPDESPSPSESPTATPSIAPLPVSNDTPNNLDVLLKPPFIFLPFIAALGLLGAIAYWILGATAARRRPQPLPAASVVHHSARPQPGLPGIEYSAPPAGATPPPQAVEDRPFSPDELSPPWPAFDRPPSEDPEPPRD